MKYTNIVNLIFELSVLKKLPRSGSFLAGIKTPDTVGEHVFRATQIAFILCEMEGGSGERSSFLVSIHDNAESRISDHHNIMKHYISGKKNFEKNAFQDQCLNLPDTIAKKWMDGFIEREENKTLEARCANDADLLELAFTAQEQLERGYQAKKYWIKNIEGALQTNTAKKIFDQMKVQKSYDWLVFLRGELDK